MAHISYGEIPEDTDRIPHKSAIAQSIRSCSDHTTNRPIETLCSCSATRRLARFPSEFIVRWARFRPIVRRETSRQIPTKSAASTMSLSFAHPSLRIVFLTEIVDCDQSPVANCRDLLMRQFGHTSVPAPARSSVREDEARLEIKKEGSRCGALEWLTIFSDGIRARNAFPISHQLMGVKFSLLRILPI